MNKYYYNPHLKKRQNQLHGTISYVNNNKNLCNGTFNGIPFVVHLPILDFRVYLESLLTYLLFDTPHDFLKFSNFRPPCYCYFIPPPSIERNWVFGGSTYMVYIYEKSKFISFNLFYFIY